MSAPTRLPQPVRRRRRAAAVVVASALAVGLGAAVLTVLTVRDHGGSSAEAVDPRASRRPASPTQAPSSPVETAPQVELSDIAWVDFHGARLPMSPRHGPRRTDDGRASGFARTPMGALFAALHIGVRANAQWGPEIFEPTIRNQVIGSDAETLLRVSKDVYRQQQPRAGVPAGEPLGPAYVSYEAFRWQGYTPQVATVDIVSAGPGPDGATVRASTRIEVQWRDGDWRVVGPPGGDWGNSATHITSLDGYTRFPAQR